MAEIGIPSFSDHVAHLIDSSHEANQDPLRCHMGVSILGHACDLYKWLTFRWAFHETPPGRIIRLFRRGKLEEAQVTRDLEAVGCVFRQTNGEQDRVDFGRHVSGSVDGVIESGVPNAEKSPHLFECKTHNRTSFNILEKDGVKESKPQHYAHCQVYLLGLKIDRALYAAVCKDDDRLYFERIHLDREYAKMLVANGQQIALSDKMPDKLSKNQSWYECKMCSYHSLCHKKTAIINRNCRTCAQSVPGYDGHWYCARSKILLNEGEQHYACNDYELHRDLK